MLDADHRSPQQRGGPTLKRLLERSWEFDFFQAVWLLQRYLDADADIGGRGPLADESIRFRPHVSVGFPPTDVRRITTYQDQAGRKRFRLDVTFMGLYGVSTPMPLHYAIDLLRSVDPYVPSEATGGDTPGADPEDRGATTHRPADTNAVRDFYDIFHHRLISLFYRCWTKYRYDVMFGAPGRDVITDYLLRMIGLPPDCDDRLLGVSPVRMIRYAGVLTQHPRSAVTLEGVVSDYFDGLDTNVEQFLGRWVPLTEADQNRIGRVNSRLGVDLTVGSQVYDLSGAFNLSVGPVDWATYESFLPGSTRYSQIRSLVELYCPDPLWFTFEVNLYAGEVPETRLTSDAQAGRLGMTSWVRTEDVGETSVIFDESSAAFEGGDAGEIQHSAEYESEYQTAGA